MSHYSRKRPSAPSDLDLKTMEAKLKKELGTSVLKPTGHSGGGCISEGQSYHTDTGTVFVKINHKSQVIHWLVVHRLNVPYCLSFSPSNCCLAPMLTVLTIYG